MLGFRTLLDPDETVLAESKKRPYGLVFQILFNRACPVILVIPLVGYALFRPAKVLTEFRRESLWLLIVWGLIFSLGVAANISVAMEYIQSALFVTSKRILRIRRGSRQSAKYSDIQKVDIEDGLASSEIRITLLDSEVIQMDYLDKKCAAVLANTIEELRSAKMNPSSA